MLTEELPLPPRGGSCEGRPTGWWFPEIEREMKGPERRVIYSHAEMAKRLCGICPIREECLQYSLENEPFGIWGGFDEHDRHGIRLTEGISLNRTIGGLRASRAKGQPVTRKEAERRKPRPRSVGYEVDDATAHG